MSGALPKGHDMDEKDGTAEGFGTTSHAVVRAVLP